jgi:hypothetical protein
MPDPKPGESQEDFLDRCIPMVMDDETAETNDQAVAICMDMFQSETATEVADTTTTTEDIQSEKVDDVAAEDVKDKPAEEKRSESMKALSEEQVNQLRQAQEILSGILSLFEEDEDMAEFAESATGHVIGLVEAATEKVVPLHLDVAIIEPGWGNKRDNHYYPKEVLERDAEVFAGVKMFESDHRQMEKSTRTWVSTVTGIEGFTDDGAPIGRVSVHDRNFAERLLALDADGLLDKMECSILAGGKAKRGEVDGKKAKIVEAITSAESVDWVTRAGAGGRALALAESGHKDEQGYKEALAEVYRAYGFKVSR